MPSFAVTNTGANGTIQSWTVPTTGNYIIEAWGAAGSAGNGGSTGGYGAYVYGTFSLTAGQVLRILVGQMGTITGTTTADGSSGGGGGGTYIAVVDSAAVYTMSDGVTKVNPLIVAAGGGGGNDKSYQGTYTQGQHGNYLTGGTSSTNNLGGGWNSTNTATTNGKSFLQGGAGGTYTRNSCTATGGFGGGGATDDTCSAGGGWTGGTATVGAYSYNAGTNTGGTTGQNAGDGYAVITLIDQTPPTITTPTPAQQYKASGQSVSMSVTATDNIGVSYVSVYMVRPDGTYFQIANAVNTSGSTWTGTYTFPTTEMEGNWRMDFRAYDAAGNASNSGNPVYSYVYYDKSVPTISAPADQTYIGSTANTGTATFTVTPTDSVSGVSSTLVDIDISYDNGTTYSTYATNIGLTKSGSNWTITFDRTAYPLAKYRLKWRAIDMAGNVSSVVTSYFTMLNGLATVGTLTASNITGTSVTWTTGSSLLNGGTAQGYGQVWSTSTGPTIALTTKTSYSGSMFNSSGWVQSWGGFSWGTKYYVRSYVTTDYGTTYSNEVTYTMLTGQPTFNTGTVSVPSSNSIVPTLTSSFTSFNGGTVTDYGHVWGTASNPTTSNSKTSLGATSTLGSFTSNLTGLNPVTTYYVRPYAITEVGTTYGAQTSFTTAKNDQSAPTAPVASSITYNSIVWTSTAGSRIVCNGVDQVSGSTWGGLNSRTVYTAYAYMPATTTLFQSSNSGTTSATTATQAPTIGNLNNPITTSAGATFYSGIRLYNTDSLTDCGFVWATTTNPTTGNNKISLGTNVTPTSISATIPRSSIVKGTTYYIRAYAINSESTTVYGPQITYTYQGYVAARLKKEELLLSEGVNERLPAVTNGLVSFYPMDGVTEPATYMAADLMSTKTLGFGDLFVPVDAPVFTPNGALFSGNSTCYLRSPFSTVNTLSFGRSDYLILEVEFKPTSASTMAVVSSSAGYNYAMRYTYQVRYNSNGTIYVSVGAYAKNPTEYQNTGWTINATTTTLYPVNQWHKVRIEYDKTAMRLYVNGTLTNTVAALADVSLETGSGTGVFQNYSQKDLYTTSNWGGFFFGCDGATVATGGGNVSNAANDPNAKVPAWSGQPNFVGYIRNFKLSKSSVPTTITNADMTAMGINLEESTTNILAAARQNFTGWTQYNSAVVTVTQGITVPEWGTDSATRIQTIGGTDTLKYYTGVETSTSGQVYSASVWIKNIGEKNVRFRTQLGNTVIVAPGQSTWAVASGTGNGTTSFQMRFEASAVADNLDFIVWRPQAERKAFSTSYVPASRAASSILDIPSNVTGNNWTLFYRFNPDVKWSNLLTASYSRYYWYMYDRNDTTKRITYSDYNGAPPAATSQPWIGYDNYVDSTYSNWHWHNPAMSIDPNQEYWFALTKNGSVWTKYGTSGSGYFEQTYTHTDTAINAFIPNNVRFDGQYCATYRDIALYNRALSKDEILRVANSTFNLPSTGIAKTVVREKALGIPTDAYYFPLSHNAKDYNQVINPSSETNTVYEDGGVWVGNAATNQVPNGSGSTLNPSYVIPGTYKPGWDVNLHRDAIAVSNWSNGYNSGVPNPSVGYHAMWVYEGKDSGPCMKFIDLNSQFKDTAGVAMTHRWLGQSINLGTPTALGWVVGTVLTVSWLQKVDTPGNGAQVGIYHMRNTEGSNGFEDSIQTITTKNINVWERVSFTTTVNSNWNLSQNAQVYVYGNQGQEGTLWVDDVQIEIKPFPNPYTDSTRGSGDLEYNFNSSIGLDWSGNWSIVYWKKPMGTQANTLVGYNIESLGSNSNTVGGGYLWWGKDINSDTLASSTPAAITPATYFGNWQMISLVKTGTTVTIKTWLSDGTVSTRTASSAGAVANYYVTPYGYDFKLGGYDNTIVCNSFFKDLVVAKRVLTDAELDALYKTEMRSYKSDVLQVQRQIKEGQVI